MITEPEVITACIAPELDHLRVPVDQLRPHPQNPRRGNTEMIAAKQPVEYYVYEGDNHNLSNNFNTVMARSVEYFDRYLKPKG